MFFNMAGREKTSLPCQFMCECEWWSVKWVGETAGEGREKVRIRIKRI